MQIKKINSKKKLTIIVLSVVAVLVIAAAVVFLWWKPFDVPTIKQPGGMVKLAPPTPLEKTEADTRKEEIEKRQAAIEKSVQQSGLTQATPVIAYVDQRGMNAYVSGVYEDDGVCTAKLSKGTSSFEKTSTAFKDATTTSCRPIDFSTDDFSEKGQWQVTLSYKSPTSEGVSKVTTFTVN